MKKLTKILMAVIIMISLAACGSNNTSSNAQINQNNKPIGTIKNTD